MRVGEELCSPGGGSWSISERWELRLCFVKVVAGVPRPGDSHDQIAWLDRDHLGSVPWLETDRAAVLLVLDTW